jgi:hypothetical protein
VIRILVQNFEEQLICLVSLPRFAGCFGHHKQFSRSLAPQLQKFTVPLADSFTGSRLRSRRISRGWQEQILATHPTVNRPTPRNCRLLFQSDLVAFAGQRIEPSGERRRRVGGGET